MTFVFVVDIPSLVLLCYTYIVSQVFLCIVYVYLYSCAVHSDVGTVSLDNIEIVTRNLSVLFLEEFIESHSHNTTSAQCIGKVVAEAIVL